MEKISVIVPVYGVEPYLRRCVDSIIRQTLPAFELILIDDGSPDRCGAICDEYAKADPRVRVIHQENAGLSAARNAGLDFVSASSDSEWICFIDSDDWIHPQYLEILLHAAKEKDSDIAVCGFYRTDGVQNENEMQTERDSYKPEFLSPEDLWDRDRVTATVAWGKLYKRFLFRSVRFPVGKLHEDEFVTYRILFSVGIVAYIPHALYSYFQNPAGIVGQAWRPERADAVDAFLEQCLFFRQNGYDRAEKQAAGSLLESSYVALSYLTERFPSEKKRIRRIRRILRKTIKRYAAVLHLDSLTYANACYRLAYPVKAKLKKKRKHFMILIRRLFHA